MSTRFYPRFVKGNPQLRIFLPDFYLKLVRPKGEVPANRVCFKTDMRMTETDIKNYLTKIYNIPVVEVRSEVRTKLGKEPGTGEPIKEEDYRLAHVTLPAGTKFTFPDLYPREKTDRDFADEKEYKKEIGKIKDDFVRKHWHRAGVPSWLP
ncbi:putative 39S ribosomal protein L23, mitochondrial [Halotydeus destructor]|nr:putative 39S ribosomal protein L23, mitochondrial [Halotydeus destructor]